MDKANKLTKIHNFKFFDIAANLADEKFKGINFGKVHHKDDLDQVVSRCEEYGVDKLLVVGGYLEDTHECVRIIGERKNWWTTVGVHPCRASEVFKNNGTLEAYRAQMGTLIEKLGTQVAAIGECGLDYDRLHFSSKEQQHAVFPMHFDLAEKYNLPMYLHSRNCEEDFLKIMKENRHRFSTGCVHSFTGTENELHELLALDLYIGINGCSLKTEENVAVVKQIPLEKLMLETDSPYCDVTSTSPAYKFIKTQFEMRDSKKYEDGKLVKRRNEPCKIIQVAEAVAGILGLTVEEVTLASYENSLKVFARND